MKAGLDFCSSLKCNEAHAATEALLTSLRSTSKDLERSLKLVNRQIGRLQKEVDARRKVQMERAMEEVKALMARYGLKPKDLAELEEQIGDGVTNVGTTPSSRNRAPALSEAA
jgi:chromosome segregation ATPase